MAKRLLVNLCVLLGSTGFALLLCELVARLVLNPADYLIVEMVPDPILGAVPSKSTRAGGFDAWGFRNRTVPATADIVAIGDSHTYGNTATMEDSWPYALGRLTGRSVYNLGLGGYGPNQYLTLLKSRALGLKPRLVICGLYMGDDFENAFLITYGLDHWAYLRRLPPQEVSFDIWETPPDPNWHEKIRHWLSRHSVIYQLLFHGSLVGRLKGAVQIRNAGSPYGSSTSLIVPESNIMEAFLPRSMVRRLDQESASVREGMRITFQLLEEMSETCRQSHVQFLVAVIPTKEMVFSDYLERAPDLPLGDVILKLLRSERLARERTFAFLGDSGIPYVDTLPALKGSVSHELYARSGIDMHPSRNGYRVIAEAVLAALKVGDAGQWAVGGSERPANPSRDGAQAPPK